MTRTEARDILRYRVGGGLAPEPEDADALRRILYDPRAPDPMFLEEPVPPREPGCDDDDEDGDEDVVTIGEIHAMLALGFTEAAGDDELGERPAHFRIELIREERRERDAAWLLEIGRLARALRDRVDAEVRDLGALATEIDDRRLRFFDTVVHRLRTAYRDALRPRETTS